jgi:hypothetical protein
MLKVEKLFDLQHLMEGEVDGGSKEIDCEIGRKLCTGIILKSQFEGKYCVRQELELPMHRTIFYRFWSPL